MSVAIAVRPVVVAAVVFVLSALSPVRAAVPEGRFVVDDDTFLDIKTRLVWAKATAPGLKWDAAHAHCEALEVGGNDDWRLPSLRELLTVVDPHSSRPFDDVPFSGAIGSAWTREVLPGSYSHIVQWNGGLLAVAHFERVSALCVRDAD